MKFSPIITIIILLIFSTKTKTTTQIEALCDWIKRFLHNIN